MARLPTPGGDNGNWGTILNEYLLQTHKADGTLKDDSVGSAQIQDNAVTSASLANDSVTATQIADGSVAEVLLTSAVQTKLNASGDWATLANKPAVIAAGADQAAARAAIGTIGLVQAAKNPDLLVTGAISLDGNDLVTSAAVLWPDGAPGTLTVTARDSNSAVLAYTITYGSPVTKTFTQPAITRNANGAATNVPAMVVS